MAAVLPNLSAARFEPGAPIDNPFFPLVPGTVATLGGTTTDPDTGERVEERNDIFVTPATNEIEGVTVTVVRDTAYANGILVEDTVDWHAQDTEGNVWYLGELTFTFEYDEEGNYVETTTQGSWQSGMGEAHAGHIMEADPKVGDNYFQEFAPGVAVDEAVVQSVDETITIGQDTFDGVLKTRDTTALEPNISEFKFYAPGVGPVREEALNEQGNVESVNERLATRTIGEDVGALDSLHEPKAEDFRGDGAEKRITIRAEDSDLDNAIGAYTFNAETGEIGEARILFTKTDEVGAEKTVRVGEGEALGLFLVPGGADLGVDLSRFENGGLFFKDFQFGEAMTIGDDLAPRVTDDAGTVLPIPAFHALDGNPDDNVNFLNPAGGVQAVAQGASAADVTLLGFEDRRTTDPAFDGDYDDVVIAIS